MTHAQILRHVLVRLRLERPPGVNWLDADSPGLAEKRRDGNSEYAVTVGRPYFLIWPALRWCGYDESAHFFWLRNWMYDGVSHH